MLLTASLTSPSLAGASSLERAGHSAVRDLGRGVNPSLAVNARGDAVFVWASPLSADGVSALRAMYRAHGGRWSEPVIVSQRGRQIADSDVAMDAAGNALAVWTTRRGRVLFRASFTVAGGWRRPRELARTSLGGFRAPAADAGPSGRFAVSWVHGYVVSDDARAVAYAAMRTDRAGWHKPELLSEDNTDSGIEPVTAVAGSGAATVVWSQRADDMPASVLTSTWRGPDHGWRSPATLFTTDEHLSDPALGTSGRRFAAGWQVSGPPDPFGVADNDLYAATRSPGSSWDAAVKVDSFHGRVRGEAPRAGGGRGLAVSWVRRPGDAGPAHLVVVRVGAGGTWMPPETAATSADVGAPNSPDHPADWNFDVLSHGRVDLVWVRSRIHGDQERVMLSHRSSNGEWSPPKPLSALSSTVFEASSGVRPGHVFAAWCAAPEPHRAGHIYLRR